MEYNMGTKICLNGFWDFSIDTDGVDRLPKRWEEHKICVPSPYNINAFSAIRKKELAGESFYVQGGDFCLYPDYPAAWNTAACGAYRRSFFVPEESRGRRIFLLFEAVAFHSRFYINGSCVREETEAFLPIEIEITESVRFGTENELVVIAENSKGYLYKDENNWNRIDYPKGSFWGEHIAGIWQDVWYEERPSVFISDVFPSADVEQERLTVRFEIDGMNDEGNRRAKEEANEGNRGGRTVRFTLIDTESKEERVLGEAPADWPLFIWDFHGEEIRLWDPDSPALYQLRAELLIKRTVCDTKLVRFGFRSFTVKNGRFYLNHRPINLKNDSWHYMGYSVQTPAYARSYYRMAKDAGVNIIRLHAQPFPSFFYDIADEMGMLLVSESAVWASHCNFSYNDAFFANSQKHLIRLVLRDRSHPSVVIWSPENECIPAYRFCGSRFIKDERELECKLYEFLKVIYEYDTSRLISCDGSGDLGGRLKLHSLHYPGFDCPKEARNTDKPITIGEMGSMYFSTPDTVCMEQGQEVLKSAEHRLRAVGQDAYRNLMGERRWASQVCVFNLIWYGLQPLPFRDRLLTYEDYTTPGIKPGRITPYLRTLNAGGDDSLPEYIPNPVWELTKQAYLPVRSYIDRMPVNVFAEEVSVLPLFLFYDEREDGEITFIWTTEADGKTLQTEKTVFNMKACESKETTLSVIWPKKEGRVTGRACVIYRGEEVYQESYPVNVYDGQRLQAEWNALGVSCLPTEEQAETKDGIYYRKSRNDDSDGRIGKIFGAGQEYTFTSLHRCVKEEQAGKPLYFDGSGQPVVWYLEENNSKKIVTSLDLSQPREAADWLLLIEMAQYLGRKEISKTKKIVFYGRKDSVYSRIFKTLGYEYETVDEERLLLLMERKQDGLLFADGGMDLGFLSNINRNNFDTVVIAGLTNPPKEWSWELDVTDRRTYQAYPAEPAVEAFGVYGTGLYGLTVGEECVIGRRLLEYRMRPKEHTIMWGVPDIDWRMWNNDPEQLKTVSLYRSEQTDNSRLSVLSLHHRGESEIWINQLETDMGHPKLRMLWKRFLGGLGAGYPKEKEKEAQRESVYDGALMCLWKEENGAKITGRGRISRGTFGCRIYSPQERTDFLYNPDMIHMEIHARAKLAVYLNGRLLGEGTEMRFTSIGLRAGGNTLLLTASEIQEFPKIVFERANGEALDLKFMEL